MHPPVGGMACTDGGIWHVHMADGSPAPSGRQRLRRSLRLPQPIRFLIDIIFVHSNGLNASWVRGAKWGATADSFQATLSHCQPPSMQLDPTSGDVRPPPGTHRRCLLSSGSRVRILPGALAELRLYLHGAACAGRLLDRRPVAEVDRGRTGIGHASCTEGEWCSPVAITIALGQQIISAPMLPDSTVGSSRRLDRAPVSANDPLRSRITYDTMRSIAGGPQG